MENRRSNDAAARAHRSRTVASAAGVLPIFDFPVLILVLSLAACGAPGEPSPRRPAVPAAVADLAAQQSGDGVVLTFTLPKNTVDGQPLAEPPAIEIYRELEPAPSGPPAAPKAVTYTIPSALVDTYLAEGRVRFVDPLKPEDFSRLATGQVVYSVRTRASKRRDSANSNLAAVRVFPVPKPIRDVTFRVTKTAIELSWTPPEETSVGGAVTALAGYHVYRAEVVPGTEAEALDPSQAKLQAPLALLGLAPSPSYRDTQFAFGHTYVYAVRSVAQYEAGAVESGDSRLVAVTPRDTFPPAPPQGLVVVAVAASAGMPAHLELSWSISAETDVAGYNVYRSDREGAPWNRLNIVLLPTPVFRDMSALSGRDYSYRVTAVDRAGNESAPSAAASAGVPGEN